MKKKILKLISIFILLLIINVNVVMAAVTVNDFTSGWKRLNGYFGGKIIDRYNANIDNTTVDIYCHNPGITPYQESDFISEKGLELKMLRNLSNPAENTRLQNIFDKGLMYITSNKCGNETVNDKCYVRNYIAVNLYEQLFPTMNTNGNNTDEQIKYLKWIIKDNFSKEIEISNSKKVTLEDELIDLNKLVGSKLGPVITSAPNISKSSTCAGKDNCDTFGQTDAALKLVARALNEAIKYAQETNSNVPTISMTKGAESKSTSGSQYSNTISHTIKITKFGKDEVNGIKPSAIVSFECKNEECDRATKKYSRNN